MNSTNIYALVTQTQIYSKNLQLTPTILWFYCKELLSRIPKHKDLLFYEFPMNLYRISKFTANPNKQVPEGTIHMCLGFADSPLGFFEFKTEGPWLGQREGRRLTGQNRRREASAARREWSGS